MAQQGTDADLGFWQGIEAAIVVKSFTLPACTVNFVRARLRETTTNNTHRVRGIIYSTGNSKLYETSSRQDITTTGATYDFTFTGATLSAGTYYVGVIGNSAADSVEISNDFATVDPFQFSVAGSGDDTEPTSPIAPTTAAIGTSGGFQDWSILVDYTEGGGGGGTIVPAGHPQRNRRTSGRYL